MRDDAIERGLREEPPDLPASIPNLELSAPSLTRPRITFAERTSLWLVASAALVLVFVLALGRLGSVGQNDVRPGGVGAERSREPAASVEPNMTQSPTGSGMLPQASPSPLSPAPSRIVTVRLDSTHTLDVTIVDESGLLVGARPATEAEQSPPDPAAALTDILAFNEPSSGPEVLTLVWIGTICDRSALLRIGARVSAISVTEGPREGCDAMGVGRGLVLTFIEPVDASSVQLDLGS